MELKGILAVEYSPFPNGGARERIIFYAHPKDVNAVPKTIPDFESLGAEWISFDEMANDMKLGKKVCETKGCLWLRIFIPCNFKIIQ